MEMEKEEEAMEIRMEEWSGSSMNNLMKTALITANSSSLSYQREAGRFRETRWRFMRAFIPEGFPGSVTPDYATFQIWDSLQGLSTYIRSMLSTQALLSAIGVGEGTATVIGATFQWFLRDFSGMLGSIGFTFFQGSNLDANAKMWRLTADFMNDLGMLMDLTSPLFPSAFIAILCFGSISRSFTGVASGATRAALTQHFALEKNAADISAKEGSQETMATMTGMMLGMLLAHFIAGNSMAIWFSFLLLTAFHLYANYKAVRCLILTTLNTERCSILLQYFMRTGQALSPKQVSEMEHVLPTWIYVWSSEKQLLHKKIQLGMRISRLRHSELMELAAAANSHHFKDRYLLIERTETIFVILHKLCTAADILQSYIHALVLANFLPINKALHLKSHAWMDEHYAGFITQLQASGWNTERLLAPTAIYKAQWEFSSMLDKTK